MLIHSVSGLRGIVGDGIDPQTIIKYAIAFANYINANNIVIGSDPRNTGDLLRYSIYAGLSAIGVKVIDIGIAPTPTVQLATEMLKADGGIAITASHNPPEWNALKFIRSDGMFLNASQNEELKVFLNQSIAYKRYNEIGTITKYDKALDEHIDAALQLVDVPLIQKHNFTVVMDPGNGAGAIITERLLNKLNCNIIKIHADIDGVFRRKLEPTPDALTKLAETVKANGADIGFAQDTDADRLAIVSNEGVAIGEEYTVALAIMNVLKKQKGPVVVNLSTSMLSEWAAKQYNVPFYRAKVGEINVAEKMKSVNAIIGGEGNGGVIYPALHYGRDSIIGISLILELMARENKPISEIVNLFPKYYIVKDKVHSKFDPSIKAKIQQLYDIKTINEDDGLWFQTKDNFWIHIRPSNTEPIVRIIVETNSEDLSKQIVSQIKASMMFDTKSSL